MNNYQMASGSPVDLSKISPLKYSMRVSRARPSMAQTSEGPKYDNHQHRQSFVVPNQISVDNNYSLGPGIMNQRNSVSLTNKNAGSNNLM